MGKPRWLKPLTQTEEKADARPPLRLTDADPGAVAQLIGRIQQIDHRETQLGLVLLEQIEVLRYPALNCVYQGRFSVLAKPLRNPLPRMPSRLSAVLAKTSQLTPPEPVTV